MSTGGWRVLAIVVAAVVLAVIGAVVVWRLALHDAAEPATIGEALQRYRREAAGGGGRIPPGVYVYATSGFESVSALGGARHGYPRRSTITVTASSCGTALRWQVLTTRADTWTICSAAGGLSLAAWHEEHTFFGHKDTTDWQCTRTAWVPADSNPGAKARWRCRGGDTLQVGTVTVLGRAPVLVGSTSIGALGLRMVVREQGGAHGLATEERWVEPETGLPLRVVYAVRTDNPSPIGKVVFEEQFRLRLLSLQPRS